jgi:arylsulfatase A
LAVGRLVEYLVENHGEYTLIIFNFDSGRETLNRCSSAKRSYGSPIELKGMKLWTIEAGFHIPGILNWIGLDDYAGSSDAFVSSLYFMATFTGLSGASLPDPLHHLSKLDIRKEPSH